MSTKTPAIFALALALLTAAAGCSTQEPEVGVPVPVPVPGEPPPAGDGGDPPPGEPPAPRTAPPDDGTTAWAPAASDAGWVDVRSLGAVGDGLTDDTAAFRAAAATGKRIFVPAPPVAYVLTRFVQLQSSIYGDGSMPLIRFVGADGDPDQGHTRNMFYVSGYAGEGLVIQGLHLDGGWTGGGNGEWSHNLNIGTSRNVTIRHNVLERPYGDNVFVGEFSGAAPVNVVIRDNTLRSPRRCNIGVNSADGVLIRDNVISKSSTYVTAIDLEPDPLGSQFVRRVTIDANVFDVVPLPYGAAAVSLNNPPGNAAAPPSGDILITNNRGTWTHVFAYMDVGPGGGGLVGVVPGLTWYNLVATGNTH